MSEALDMLEELLAITEPIHDILEQPAKDRWHAISAWCSDLRGAEKEVPSHWEEDERFPVEDWEYEVRNGDTRLGYSDWVENRRELFQDEDENMEELGDEEEGLCLHV